MPDEDRRLLIVKVGETFPDLARTLGDFDDWVAAGLGLPAATIRVVDPRRMAALPDPAACAGVVMTGAHAMLTEQAPWMLRLADWLRRVVAAEVPFLGICFGHQLLAQALGGRVDYHPGGREIGTVDIELLQAAADDALFAGLPGRFAAHAVHAQTVTALPAGAVRLAANAFEPSHAFRCGRRAWGIQFHPEFDVARMRGYVGRLADAVRAAGRDPALIRRDLAEAPVAAELLPRFAGLVFAEDGVARRSL
ncbi:MAG: glutamine amidotransferase [Betaproteobacteria bacterium]|nr:glutamine amidotransferase [Betaproteobacteria bacterium]